jgi:DNA-binding HxlR family transcriptional regulator
MKSTYDLDCNLAKTLNILGDRWTILVLHRIYKNINTFKELEESLESIPTNILSDRLKLLTENGLITKKLYSEHPPRYEYIITEKGRDFNHVFNSMTIWANKYLEDCNRTIGHKKCNSEVSIKYYCKECDEYFDEKDLVIIDKHI